MVDSYLDATYFDIIVIYICVLRHLLNLNIDIHFTTLNRIMHQWTLLRLTIYSDMVGRLTLG